MRHPTRSLDVALAASLLLSGCANFNGEVSPNSFQTPIWTVTEGIQNPESAYLDPESGFLFLSNVAGDSATKDGAGWISKLTPDGKVIAAQWVSGLNAPKGLRSHGGMLYVSDLTDFGNRSRSRFALGNITAIPHD